MASPSIIVRALDANGDIQWGNGRGNFISDKAAVAQLILTRLRLLQGEWWADTSIGLPVWQSILGVPGSGTGNAAAVSLLIENIILQTPFVLGITGLQYSYSATTRQYKFFAQVETQFGVIGVSYAPTSPNQSLP